MAQKTKIAPARIAPHRIHRKLTPAEKKRIKKLRSQLEKEKPEILAEALRWKQAHDAAAANLRHAFEFLKAERKRQGLSLDELGKRCGMSKSALSRLENDLEANPTMTTLCRYAEALGKDLLITLVDQE